MAVVAAGNEAALHGAIGDCRPGGTIIVVGTFWENVCFPGVVAMTKELTIHSSFAYGHNGSLRDIEAAAKLLAKQPEIVETLITHRFPLDRAAEAFRVAADRGAGAIKVSLMP
jgi:threonine dehydrogenase-like Zn-dependent dehydrogenase